MDSQPSLLGEGEPASDGTGIRLRGGASPAAARPVARVLLETAVPHLARPFDYGVTQAQDAEAVPGVRVRVRFSGRLVSGFLLARAADTDVAGEIAPLERVVSPLPVADDRLMPLVREVADRWAGSLPDVLRLAVPPRHAAGERTALTAVAHHHEEPPPVPGPDEFPVPSGAPASYEVYLAALSEWLSPTAVDTDQDDTVQDDTDQDGPRAAYALTPGGEPGTGWISAGLRAAAIAVAAGRSVLWLVPDHRELDALSARLGPLAPHTVRLSADQGPQARWSAWVRAHGGAARLVIGTRAAAFAPLDDLALVLLMDDGSDHYAEQRAPYPHARETCLVRVRQTGAALLLLDHTRTVEVQRLVESGWVGSIDMAREDRRMTAPLVLLPHADGAPERMPPEAFEVLRGALGRSRRETAHGPVLVQVPRAGYLPVVACARCGDLLDCPQCGRKLSAAGAGGPFACAGCGLREERCPCQRCGATRVRAVVRGLERTVEELQRAFADVPVIRSGGEDIVGSVGPQQAVVVATTGAEPYAEGGYAAAVLLDSLWPGPGLDGVGRAIARRLRALALVRASADGGRALVLDDTDIVVRVLQTFDPVRFAHAELADRRSTRLPPVVRTLRLTGPRREVLDVLGRLTAELGEGILSPLLVEDGEDDAHTRLLAFGLTDSTAVSAALRTIAVHRSATGADVVRHVLDPVSAL
ncbi:primosomal protein N' [Brevibacterium jeotgali]|uniref:Replication restart DNA helicase PriA n=1 Tax=Brevibacterium jeotgali TaxID=1262550 RepID=A0A2H1L219_9MICO|nr:primosomal protein N' [Brevibacterium jeotgali]TWC02944.1 replication restart DNA helicase PriA [Brevibacterium jeotgali]SMY10966.1 replication restart DNA helicase PriA [Brevibacterium jeotgali]